MFGGLYFPSHDHMFVSIVGETLMARVGRRGLLLGDRPAGHGGVGCGTDDDFLADNAFFPL